MRIAILILGFKGLSLVLICSCDSAVSTDRDTAPIYENIRCRPKEAMRVFTAGMPVKLNSIQLRRQRDCNFYSRRGEDIYDDGNRPRPGCKHPIHSRTSESLRRANKCGLLDVRFHGWGVQWDSERFVERQQQLTATEHYHEEQTACYHWCDWGCC